MKAWSAAAAEAALGSELKAFTTEELLGAKAWSTYQRLLSDKHPLKAQAHLRNRGMTEPQLDMLLQSISKLPEQWLSERVRDKLLLAELKQLSGAGQQFRRIAESPFKPSSSTLSLIDLEVSDGREDIPARHRPYTLLAARAADQLEARVAAERAQIEKRRRLGLTGYVLVGIYERMAVLLPRQPIGRPERRAPNLEAELLAETVLNRSVPRGTLSRLRAATRRRYVREK